MNQMMDTLGMISSVVHLPLNRALFCHSETWAGIPLTPFTAYGFRLYQNNSQLGMHVDRMQTHIISFILHIDSSDDAGTWQVA